MEGSGDLEGAEAAFKEAKKKGVVDPKLDEALVRVKAARKDALSDSFGGLFKKEGFSRAARTAERTRREGAKRDVGEKRRKYRRHVGDVVARALTFEGGDVADYAQDVEALVEEGVARTDDAAPRSASLKPARTRLWRLFFLAARRHERFRGTPEERQSCEACGAELPSEALIAFEKKHGTPAHLKHAPDPLLADMALQEEMRDAHDEPDEKVRWALLMKVREKMGKGPPVTIPYESEARTNEIISSLSP